MKTLISKNIKSENLSVSGKLNVSGALSANSSITVGTSGSPLYNVVSGVIAVNPGSIDTVSKGSVNVTITGLRTTDRIFLQPPSGLDAGLLYCGADITATNTLTIYLYNKTGGSIDDVSNNWKYTYLVFTN